MAAPESLLRKEWISPPSSPPLRRETIQPLKQNDFYSLCVRFVVLGNGAAIKTETLSYAHTCSSHPRAPEHTRSHSCASISSGALIHPATSTPEPQEPVCLEEMREKEKFQPGCPFPGGDAMGPLSFSLRFNASPFFNVYIGALSVHLVLHGQPTLENCAIECWAVTPECSPGCNATAASSDGGCGGMVPVPPMLPMLLCVL